jgi:hypothetical protein
MPEYQVTIVLDVGSLDEARTTVERWDIGDGHVSSILGPPELWVPEETQPEPVGPTKLDEPVEARSETQSDDEATP